MAEATAPQLSIGDRSQGYEITGPGALAGLPAAFAGKDSRDRDAGVTLIWLAENQDQSALFDAVRPYEQIDRHALVGPRTVVRFGAGSAVVIGKEQGAPLIGEMLSTWLARRAPVDLAGVATLFTPALEALSALHGMGLAHGHVSAGQAYVDDGGKLRLLGPWLAHGGQPAQERDRTLAPELVSGGTATPSGDVYAISALLYWALSGKPAPSADTRLAAKAQRDEDPYVSLRDAVPSLDASLVEALDRAMRLHPATRPQAMAELTELLAPHVGAVRASVPPGLPVNPAPSAIPSPSPWGPGGPGGAAGSSSQTLPPPLPRHSGTVPPIPKSTQPLRRTSTIGQAPPPLPSKDRVSAATKRKLGIGTILSFLLALGVAWLVASGGLSGGDEPRVDTSPTPAQTERPTPVPRPEPAPRKGPSSTPQQQTERAADGVLEQFCNSLFTFEAARGGGTNALRAYLQRCEGQQSEYVEAARDALGLN